MARVRPLTPAEVRILEALSQYRLITSQQVARLDLANITHARERLQSLHTAGLVHATLRGKLAGPHVYVLSNRGAAALEEWTEGRVIAKGSKAPMENSEYLDQRVAIVDTHIALRQWAEAVGLTVNWVKAELSRFPKGEPGKFQAVTSVTHDGVRYDADMIASITTTEGVTMLFAIEVETGGRSQRLTNFKAKLPSRLLALKGDVIEHALAWPSDENHRRARMLFVFKTADMMDRAIEMLNRFEDALLKRELRRVFLGRFPLDFGALWNLGSAASVIGPLQQG